MLLKFESGIVINVSFILSLTVYVCIMDIVITVSLCVFIDSPQCV